MIGKLVEFRWLRQKRDDLIDQEDYGDKVILQVRHRLVFMVAGDVDISTISWSEWEDVPTVREKVL